MIATGVFVEKTFMSRPVSPHSTRLCRVRELVYAYRPLRAAEGRVIRVPSIALNSPTAAATVITPLLMDQRV